jgi:hypothetical protein
MADVAIETKMEFIFHFILLFVFFIFFHSKVVQVLQTVYILLISINHFLYIFFPFYLDYDLLPKF